MSHKLAVLLVEDSESDAQLILRALRKGGSDPVVTRVETDAEMKAALSTQTWDIVISDYNLPQFNGEAALALLNDAGLDIPFIIVSGEIGEETAVTMMKAGAHDYLKKNDLARLAPAVQRELEQTEERRKKKLAEQTLKKISRAVEASPVCIIIADAQGLIEYVNPKFTELTGYEFEEARGKPTSMLKSGQTPPEAYEELWKTIRAGNEWKGELLNRKKNGETYWEKISISSVADEKGSITHFVALSEDVTERKAADEQIRRLNAELKTLATTDYLTNLYNRRYFMERGAQEFKRAKRNSQALALIMLDIDNFKQVNDAYGHETGDLALKSVAAALKTNLREIDVIGRMGGDEFTALLPDTTLKDAEKIARRAQKDIANMGLRQTENSAPIPVSISIGLAEISGETNTIEDLIRNADAAMYQAKRAGRNCIVTYQPESNQGINR